MELKEAINKLKLMKYKYILTNNDDVAIDTVLEELDNRISKKDIEEILDYQFDLWNTPNKQKEYNIELVATLEDLLDKEIN